MSIDRGETAGPRYVIHDNVRIPMRDGVHLGAVLYVPKDGKEARSCVLIMWPYDVETLHRRAAKFAELGFATVLVDVRGRGNSEGRFEPFANEMNDGRDLIDWLAAQPFCNGRVGMWGGSYSGTVQWSAARTKPAALWTIVPVAAACPGVDVPMRSNIFNPFQMQWLTVTSGATMKAQRSADSGYWKALFSQWHSSGRPFRDLDQVVGTPSPAFQRWLDHPCQDEYWDSLNPSAEDYAAIDMPILTITGIYDDDQPGALAHYNHHMRHAGAVARNKHFLVIGPWNHGGCAVPTPNVGGVAVGAAGVIDVQGLNDAWLGWALNEGDFPEFLKNRVSYYVMGRDVWRYADTLEQVTERHELLYLDSRANADDVLSSGSLSAAPGVGSPDHYAFDPSELKGLPFEIESRRDPMSLTEQGLAFSQRGQALFYHSAPFDQDVDVCGFFQFEAWLAIDRPDADFYVSVHEIDLQGQSVLLATDLMRARYRESLRNPAPVGSEALLYKFERFHFASRMISRGHRLRLVVAPVGRMNESCFAERNFGGGGVVAEESVEDARVLTVTLLHDQDHQSVLRVPIGRDETAASQGDPAGSIQ